MEDTLRSASPNIEARSRSHAQRMMIWRTQRHISTEDMQEISDRCDDFDHIEIYNGYAETLQKAMSENNIVKLSGHNSKRFRSFHPSDDNEEGNSISGDSESQSIEMGQNMKSEGVSEHEVRGGFLKQQTLLYNDPHQVDEISEDSEDEAMSVDKATREKRSSANPRLLSNKSNSIVDIDTVGGKVSFYFVTNCRLSFVR